MGDVASSVKFSRIYGLEDQNRFAILSGDYNPMHIDQVAARRMLVGEPVVHGVHLLLCGLEAIAQLWWREKKCMKITSLKASFPKPALVGDEVSFEVSASGEGAHKVQAIIGVDCVLEAEIVAYNASTDSGNVLKPAGDVCTQAVRLVIEDIESAEGAMPIWCDCELVNAMFPACLGVFGEMVMADLLAMTRLVGMYCPGLQSVFNKIDLKFHSRMQNWVLNYRVFDFDKRFFHIRMDVVGDRFKGVLSCFYRPEAAEQETTENLKNKIGNECFKNQVALIIGGTRGLGEVTAKIIAAGGGHPIITYYQGHDDALRVANDILSSGHKCDIVYLNVADASKEIARIFSGENSPNSIYYFATPKIFVRRREFFNRDLFFKFNDYYVRYFSAILDASLGACSHNIKVFYPSSVAIDENVRDLFEYALAKKNSEEVCNFYNTLSDRVSIITHRLPRIRTDQTATIIPYPSEEPFDVMFDIIKKMSV
ncbi:enoyl-(acyl carrier protein) reductase [mine drainage metagenome]|uniref:Enoyl-(Acyl carrier protein) reductase n=1 Tax=mine drainage metagenome TaxID=410659 RepID=A0A1J5RKU8_9ZZZZ